MTVPYVRADHADLVRFVAACFAAEGVGHAAATRGAEALVYADASGMTTHGVANLVPLYLAKLRSGEIAGPAEPRVVADSGSLMLLDGGRSLGLATAAWAASLAVDRARQTGIAFVGVRNSTHLGSAGAHAARMAAEGMVGLVTSNLGGQAIMPSPAGRTPLVGTNPFSVAAPAATHAAFVLDMSTSVVPTGRIKAAARRGEAVPPGWLVDDHGEPVTDPTAYADGRARLMPLGGLPHTGGHKGFGLALVVEILSGALTGAAFGPGGSGREHDVGHALLALDPQRLAAGFGERMDALLGAVLRAVPSGDEPVTYPGWREAAASASACGEGVPIEGDVYDQLCVAAAELDVAAPVLVGEMAR